MIVGVGIDIVEVERFKTLARYSKEQLLRVFSPQELLSCQTPPPLDTPAYTGPRHRPPTFLSSSPPSTYLLRRHSGQASSKRSDVSYLPIKLASRFAAKEAFYKALSSALVKLKKTNKKFSFISSSKHIEVVKKTWDVPTLEINWIFFENVVEEKLPPFEISLSLSDEKIFAAAYVILSL
jgi:phosphopantetheine--protein transferase-like protein